jgi:hypothetical protein
MMKPILPIVGVALVAVLLPSSAALSRSCTVIEGQAYDAAGKRIRRCPKGAEQRRFKILTTREITEPRCAGKRRGYSFVRKKAQGQLERVTCTGAAK